MLVVDKRQDKARALAGLYLSRKKNNFRFFKKNFFSFIIVELVHQHVASMIKKHSNKPKNIFKQVFCSFATIEQCFVNNENIFIVKTTTAAASLLFIVSRLLLARRTAQLLLFRLFLPGSRLVRLIGRRFLSVRL